MNITLKISNINFKKRLPQEVKVFSAEELQEFIQQGAIIKRNKQYHMILHYRQFIIECPLMRMGNGSYQMIWPSFKLPNRPYPVFVYLYAVALYLSCGESQRATAEKVMHFFGLTTFSHSTISRFLPRLYPILPNLIQYGAQIINNWGINTSQVVPRKHWDKSQHALAEQLNRLIEPVLRAPPEFGSWLAYEHWTATSKFIV